MCLYSTYQEPRIATKPIKCFKLLKKTKSGKLCTPYRLHMTHIGDTINAKIYGLPKKISIGRFRVEGEGVHAYNEFIPAYCRLSHYSDIILVRCTIPEGAKYWEGMDDDIAATELHIDKEVDISEIDLQNL